MKKLLLATAILLAGCTTKPPLETLRFPQPHTEMYLEVKLFNTPDELDNYAKANYPNINRNTYRRGMAVWPVIKDKELHKCVILVPRFQYDVRKATQIYGHEILHCIYGQYHN